MNEKQLLHSCYTGDKTEIILENHKPKVKGKNHGPVS